VHIARFIVAIFALSLGGRVANAQPPAEHWVGSWATAVQAPEQGNALAPADLTDATLRQVVHLSLGGGALRVRLSNAFGTAPLHIAAAHIARPTANGGIDPATDKALTFSGAPDVTIPAGADYVSDPVAFDAGPSSDVAISLYFDKPPVSQTGHPGSRATSFVAHGNLVGAAQLPNAKTVEHWYEIEGLDVQAAAGAESVIAFGDSITDGHGSTTNGNDRWPDVVARTLRENESTSDIAVLNAGIGGNHLLTDGLGPNALARFDRDVLTPPGVKAVILLEGINDLGGLTFSGEVPLAAHEALVQRIIAADEQIVTRAHAHGILVYGAPITPDMGSDYYHPDAQNEADRQAVNAWIRVRGNFDGVIDFDAVVRDPAHPDHLLPAYDSGDHLHPGPAGYRVMGEAAARAIIDMNR
jgi:lysophospholipase L1-like esterase